MVDLMTRLVKEETGQGMAEYVMILVAVAVVAIVGYQALGGALNAKVNAISGSF